MDVNATTNDTTNSLVGLKARLDNDIVYLDIHSASLYIKYPNTKIKIVKLKDIKTLHTKNQDAFLLKLQLHTDALVFSFDNHNARDLAKNILLKLIKPGEKVKDEVLHKDSKVKQVYANTKGVIDPNTFWGVYKEKVVEMYNIMLQQPTRELNFETDEFIFSLPPVLLKIFGELKCSINQFYNYIKQSNFYDIRNAPNFIDRMLVDNLRDYKIESNYAVRLNNQSLININSHLETKDFAKLAPKYAEFEPIYHVEETEEEREETGYEIRECPLTYNLPLKVEGKDEDFRFDKKDFKRVVDLSKLVFKCKKDKIDLSKDLQSIEKVVEEIKKKYGEKNVKFYRRLLPDWFM